MWNMLTVDFEKHKLMKYITVFVLFLTGCITAAVTKLNSKPCPAKAENCKIKMFTQKPEKKFKEIVLLSALGQTSQMLAYFKKQACLAGGDAIIILSIK